MTKAIYIDGVSLGPGHCKIIVKFIIDDMPEDEDTPANNAVLDCNHDRGVTGIRVDFPIVRIASTIGSPPDFFVAGRLGLIGQVSEATVLEEQLEGPDEHGFIRDLRWIGNHLFAAGMGRQVYRRSGTGQWSRFDEGILNIPIDFMDVTGLNAIDGLSEDDIYGVGFNGEIWHCVKGVWYAIVSPTNLLLERVKVVRKDLVYACGQSGVLVHGHNNTWDYIEHSGTEDDFSGMEWFKDTLFLATRNGLFKLIEGTHLEPVDFGLASPRTFSQLHADKGALWTFGSEHLAWTEDGDTWHDLPLK